MSLFVNVFCASRTPMTVGSIEEYARDAWLAGPGEPHPTVRVTAEHEDGWATLEVWLPAVDRPVLLFRDTAAEDVEEFVSEALEQAPADATDRLRSLLAGTRQVVGFELLQEYLDEDAWELVSVLQSAVAREGDGVIVDERGVYDDGLNEVLGLSDRS